MGRGCALGLVALSSFGFAVQSLVVKLITRDVSAGSVPAMEIVFFRGWLQAIGCYATLSCHGPVKRRPCRWYGDSFTEFKWLFLRGFVGFGGICFGFKSVSLIGIAESQVVSTVTPCFAGVYARVFLKEPWHALEKVAAAVAMAGVAVQFGPHAGAAAGGGSAHLLGLVYALLGAASAAGAHVLVRLLGTRIKVDWPILMLYQAMGQILLSPLALLAFGETPRFAATRRTAALVATCGSLGFLSQVAMTRGMQRAKSASASIMRLSGLPWSFLFQALATDDPVTPRTVFGAAIIVSAMGIIVYSTTLNAPAPPPPKAAYAPVSVELPPMPAAAFFAIVGADDSEDDDGDDGVEPFDGPPARPPARATAAPPTPVADGDIV